MAGVVDIGSSWSTGDQPTAAALNAKWTSCTFNSSAVDGATTALSSGAIIVKDLGVTTAKIAASAVTNGKIGADAIDGTKIADLAVGNEHLELLSIATGTIQDDAVTYAKVELATAAQVKAESSAGVQTPETLTNHPGIAKAWGVVENSGASAALRTGSYNVTSVAQSAADNQWTRVTLDNAMDGTNYVVQVTEERVAGGVGSNNATISIVSATTFDIGVNTDNVELQFTVFGHLA